ncbi:MAG: C-terminal helicase domain-containing protein, partial [Acidobacteria bacterium]|nr:C-terminal helicase domain-containing protein [Acidobacteriota bacterium]
MREIRGRSLRFRFASRSATGVRGDRSQNQRNQALRGFQEGHYRVLVATDVAVRGIHVDGISRVVNYDLPQVPEDFIRRVGRTGNDLRDPLRTRGHCADRTHVSDKADPAAIARRRERTGANRAQAGAQPLEVVRPGPPKQRTADAAGGVIRITASLEPVSAPAYLFYWKGVLAMNIGQVDIEQPALVFHFAVERRARNRRVEHELVEIGL